MLKDYLPSFMQSSFLPGRLNLGFKTREPIRKQTLSKSTRLLVLPFEMFGESDAGMGVNG